MAHLEALLAPAADGLSCVPLPPPRPPRQKEDLPALLMGESDGFSSSDHDPTHADELHAQNLRWL
ncbi:hypothetical protein [Cyanobium sp. CH-040]|uniref:hypothetical protein n=1 Tax=Cyanobium sp. CH-040 TaxID=2823708 RepID=UPI0020CC2207|nr:hypothetical protein [Cyanobium sp. CH-040]MCP9928601.1 hypothetical protein [Cyanobium sp. CH-040]